MKKILSFVVIIGLLLFTWFIVTAHPFQASNSPRAVDGRLQLTDWDFDQQGAIRLQGTWELYDGQLLSPDDFQVVEGQTAKQTPKLTAYFNPSSTGFNKKLLSKPFKEGIGVRTYRVVISLAERSEQEHALAMKLIEVQNSSVLYVNGKKVGGHGVIALDKAQYTADAQSYEAYFSTPSNELEIILQVANYSQHIFSYNYVIWLGHAEHIAEQTAFNIAIDLCGAAICFIIFMYHLYIAAYTRSSASLYFSLIFFALSLSFLLTGEMLINRIVEYISYELIIKLRVISRFAMGILLQLYLVREIKGWMSPIMNKLIISGYALMAAAITIVDVEIYFSLSVFFYLLLMIVILYKFWRVLYIWYRQRFQFALNSVFLYVILIFCWAVSFLNNTLFSFGLVSNKLISSVAISLFIILSQLLLAFRYIRNVRSVKRLDQVKEDFFVNTAYYLQAPLDTMLNMTDQLAKQQSQQENMYPQIIMLNQLAQRMIQHVNDIKDLTMLKHEELKLRFDAISLYAVLQRAIDGITLFSGDSKTTAQLSVAKNLMVLGDEERVRQVLYTLIRQAAHRGCTSVVQIEAKVVRNHLIIHIQDNGEIISQNKQARLFDPNYMDDAEVGFNLFMTREMITAMGGKLLLAWSEEGKGTCFELSLPGYQSRQQQEVDEQLIELRSERLMPLWDELGQHTEHQRTILVVEDQYYNIQTLFMMLQDEPYNVLYAYSGEEALHMLQTYRVDLVLMDIGLPRQSGIAACRHMREQYSRIELPIILMSVSMAAEELEQGFNAGANDYIRKPFLKHEIIARVKSQLSISSSMELALQNELAFLQTQIEPHFIYNAMNSVISLCYIDSHKAAEVLTDFSQYLRLVFDIEASLTEVPLHRELELAEVYINIERARFGDKYKLVIDVPQQLRDIRVPSFCIQPLVENAVKHGLYHKPEGGVITVKAAVEGAKVIIMVEDNGVGMSEQQLQQLLEQRVDRGVGFGNVQKRIRYQTNATFELASKQGYGTIITISFTDMNIA